MSIMDYREQIYAGVLGKLIGVYMGRPVEGWPYEKIRARFDLIDRYVAEETGAPFIVPDDDISGTFGFWRALEDNGYPTEITAEQIGEAWLNYIAEDKTILWWGGLARSTEHSAYLRLKAGVKPPLSGSGERNGMVIAEQIGSQIFIDTWALVNPGDPERAAHMAREASVVSHDGIAVEAAVYLAAVEAMAFTEKNLDVLLSSCRKYIGENEYGKKLNALLDEIIAVCDRTHDWREVRDYIETHHGYAKYLGNCPMVTNHLGVIMALKFGGDDFRKSISIAASAGWDADCNAGNVGCLNAIRLGLSAIDAQAELRAPVADRMYAVSTDGGDCVFDAVREARKLIKAAAALRGEQVEQPTERYAFEFPGSVQGFRLSPCSAFSQAATGVENAETAFGESGLVIRYRGVSGSVTAQVAVQTYVDPTPKAAPDTSYFEVYASPALYSGQTVAAHLKCPGTLNPNFRFFIDYYDADDQISTWRQEGTSPLHRGENFLTWEIPDTGGRAVYRLGLELCSDQRRDGCVILKTLDWGGAPKRFHMGTALELTPGLSPFITRTKWMMAFMNSTRHTGPDITATLAISHPEQNGVLTIGAADWADYAVESAVQFVHARYAGLVARAVGHRRYYAAILGDGKISLVCRQGAELTTLAVSRRGYREGQWYSLRLEVKGDTLTLFVDGAEAVSCADGTYLSGACGFVVEEGAIVAREFTVTAL